MKEKLYTIELTDAVKSGDECLFCWLERKLEQEMLEFVRDMDYRTEDYRAVVEAYIERSIGEGPQSDSAEQLP